MYINTKPKTIRLVKKNGAVLKIGVNWQGFPCIVRAVFTLPFLSAMRRLALLTTGFILFAAPYAAAQSGAIDIIPAPSAEEGGPAMEDLEETHPPLKLSPDKSEIISLPEDVGTVVIGNPAHFSILADSPRRLIAVPKMPGASYVTILNKEGAVLMQRHVLVAPPKEKYVRVRKTCYGESAKGGCVATQTYYCPDICHEISPTSGAEENAKTDGKADGASDGASDQTSDEQAEDKKGGSSDGSAAQE